MPKKGTHLTSETESAAPARRVENGAGLLLMGLGMFLFSAVDASAKFLTEGLHPLQIVWTRQLGLFAAAMVLLVLHGPRLFRTRHLNLQLFRGLVAVLFLRRLSALPVCPCVGPLRCRPVLVVLRILFPRFRRGVRWRRSSAPQPFPIDRGDPRNSGSAPTECSSPRRLLATVLR